MAYNRGSFETLGGTSDSPNYIYYNCDIINNRTDDINQALLASPDPQVRFNETRDTALVKDASQYEFSIIRFTMNGANRDLPLFIPNIQTGQSNVNLTSYSVALTYQQSWNTNLGLISFNIAPQPTFVVYQPETQNPILAPTPRAPTIEQDLSTRYYWVYTYQHWLNLVNQTILTAHQTLYTQFQAAWAAKAGLTDPFPYATFNDFFNVCVSPQIVYAEETRPLFTIYGDSSGFGQRLLTFTSTVYVAGTAGAQTQPRLRLFFNTNMEGIFANFSNLYWNRIDIGAITYNGVTYPAFPNGTAGNPLYTYPLGYVPEGYTNEMMFSNKFYQNIQDYRLAPYSSGAPPLGYVPSPQNAKVYWTLTQDYKSTDSLWSPISSIVFTTTLLPIKKEAASEPVFLGTSNLGDSAPTSKSAFEPIITDIALDLAANGADDYRQFLYYAPTAEYRMADLSPSKQEIRNIDIQVFWKNRLNNQLYPVSMFNLSSVSIKMLFRHKRVGGIDKSY
jgi:hypothetical protein